MAGARDLSSTEGPSTDFVECHLRVLQRISVEEIAARALRTAAKGSAVVLDEDGTYKCIASVGACVPPPGAVLDVESGISGLCLRTGSILRCDDAESDSRVNAEACRALGVRSILIIPVEYRGHVAGLIEVVSDEPSAFDDSATAHLIELSKDIANAIHSERDLSTSSAALESQSESTTSNAVDLSSYEPPITQEKKRLRTAGKVVTVILAAIAIPAVILGSKEKRNREPDRTLLTIPANTPSGPDVSISASAPSHDPRLSDSTPRDPYRYATALVEGAGTPDLVEIYSWYVVAASQGDKRGEEGIQKLAPRMTEADIGRVRNRLGNIFEYGEGVTADKETAFFWYTLAEHAGYKNASTDRLRLAANLTAEQRRNAEHRAMSWLRLHSAGKAQSQIIP